MSSTMNSRIRYVKDRCINAYWMVRTGKFRLIFKSLYVELAHRGQIIRNFLSRAKELDDSQVPGSAFVNKRKVLPPSYRPTGAQPAIMVPLKADPEIIAKELKHILSTIVVEQGFNS